MTEIQETVTVSPAMQKRQPFENEYSGTFLKMAQIKGRSCFRLICLLFF